MKCPTPVMTRRPINDAKALHDVKLVRMRRQEIVDEGAVAQTDCVDDKRIALIMANGFSVPGEFHVR